jgi:hypothetical protein
MPGSTEPLLGRSLPQSANGSREGSISSPNIFATSAASGITMRCHLPGNGSSSSSSGSDELITQERLMYERQIFHLQQQHVQTQQQLAYTLNALDHMRSSGVSPSVAMPHIGNLPQTLPFMTNRVHLNNNGAEKKRRAPHLEQGWMCISVCWTFSDWKGVNRRRPLGIWCRLPALPSSSGQVARIWSMRRGEVNESRSNSKDLARIQWSQRDQFLLIEGV